MKLREEAVLQTLTQDVLKTREIEGEQHDPTLVRSSLAIRLGIAISALPPAHRNVEGMVEVMQDTTTNYAATLTDERLFVWHADLFPTGRCGMTRSRLGDWWDDSAGPMQGVSGLMGRVLALHGSASRSRQHGFDASMSGKGNCYCTAAIETFFKTIKAELI